MVEPMRLMSMDSPDGPKRARTPIIYGLIVIAVLVAIVSVLPPVIAAIAIGILISAVVCYVVLMAMPRATQISIMGAAIGISADAGYAQVNDQTPVTVANGLIKMADSLVKAVGLVSTDAHVNVADVSVFGVWSFILSMIVFMGLSFLVKHDA